MCKYLIGIKLLCDQDKSYIKLYDIKNFQFQKGYRDQKSKYYANKLTIKKP